MAPDEAAVVRAKQAHAAWVMGRPGVEGLGVGRTDGGAWRVRVYTNGATEPTRQGIRDRFGAVPVEFLETGPIEPHDPA